MKSIKYWSKFALSAIITACLMAVFMITAALSMEFFIEGDIGLGFAAAGPCMAAGIGFVFGYTRLALLLMDKPVSSARGAGRPRKNGVGV